MQVTLTDETFEGFQSFLVNEIKVRNQKGKVARDYRWKFKQLVRFFKDKPFNRANFYLFMDYKRKTIKAEYSLNHFISMVKHLDTYFALYNLDYSLQFEKLTQFKRPKSAWKNVLTFAEMVLVAECDVRTCEYQNDRWRLLVTVMSLTGSRVNETCRLETAMVGVDTVTYTFTKNGKPRTVPLAEGICSQLKTLAGNQHYVFSVSGVKPITRGAVNRIIKDKIKVLDIKIKVTPHLFRHSFISNMVNSGASLISVRDIVGHGNISTTNTYLHSDLNGQRTTLASFHPFYKAEQSFETTINQIRDFVNKVADLTQVTINWSGDNDSLNFQLLNKPPESTDTKPAVQFNHDIKP